MEKRLTGPAASLAMRSGPIDPTDVTAPSRMMDMEVGHVRPLEKTRGKLTELRARRDIGGNDIMTIVKGADRSQARHQLFRDLIMAHILGGRGFAHEDRTDAPIGRGFRLHGI